jgi:hypothetical protein
MKIDESHETDTDCPARDGSSGGPDASDVLAIINELFPDQVNVDSTIGLFAVLSSQPSLSRHARASEPLG